MKTDSIARVPVKANSRLSLHPLDFEEAVTDILKVKPEPKAPKKKTKAKTPGKNGR
jgi:hypothetical protein